MQFNDAMREIIIRVPADAHPSCNEVLYGYLKTKALHIQAHIDRMHIATPDDLRAKMKLVQQLGIVKNNIKELEANHE